MKLRNIIAIMAALPVVAGMTGCKSDEELDAKPAKEILIVGDGSIEYRANEEGTEVPVTADCHWTVSYDQGNFGGELTVQPSQGNGNGTLVIRSDQNTMPNTNREATITLTSDGGLKQKITVRQTSGDPSLNISADEFSFQATETTPQLLTVTSNGAWELRKVSDAYWFHIVDADGNEVTGGQAGATVMYVSVDAAVNDVNRTSTFAVVYNNKTVNVTVRQSGMTNIYLNTTSAVDRFSTQGGEGYVAVECNAQWNAYIPSTVNWVHIEPAAGIGNGELRIYCEPNENALERVTAVVVISGSETPHQSIILIEQDGVGTVASDQTMVGDLQLLYASMNSASFIFSYVSDQLVGDCGLVYSSTNPYPTLTGSDCTVVTTSEGGSSYGNVMATLNGLQQNTTYYVRAFVFARTGGGGYVYSSTIPFTTQREPGSSDNPDPGLAPKH